MEDETAAAAVLHSDALARWVIFSIFAGAIISQEAWELTEPLKTQSANIAAWPDRSKLTLSCLRIALYINL